MAEATKPARRRAKSTADQAGDVGSTVGDQTDDVQDTASDTADTAKGTADDATGNGGKTTITSELKDTVREAAIEVLKPVMRKATTSAAKYAVTQGPTLMKDKVGPRLEQAGGAGELAKGLASKGGGVTEKIGGVASSIGEKVAGKKKEGESPSGTGRGRRLPVQESIDVGVDLETAYDQYTQFEDWPKFMHRVERIEQRDDATLMWHENIWGVRRSWEAEITEQKPCERIVWRSKGGTQTVGVVTFHRLSDNLTRIIVTMDFQPKGLFEKTASGMRMSRRALRSDLMRFKAFVEMGDEATGAWRGTIEEGEVVDEGREDGEGEEGRDDEDAQARGEDEDADAGEESEDEEEPEASEDFEDEDEDEDVEEEEEEEEEPRGKGSRGRFTREDEEEGDDEPAASSDDEEAEPVSARRSRRRRTTTSSGRSSR